MGQHDSYRRLHVQVGKRMRTTGQTGGCPLVRVIQTAHHGKLPCLNVTWAALVIYNHITIGMDTRKHLACDGLSTCSPKHSLGLVWPGLRKLAMQSQGRNLLPSGCMVRSAAWLHCLIQAVHNCRGAKSRYGRHRVEHQLSVVAIREVRNSAFETELEQQRPCVLG
jgi:hypothetical protein